MSILLFDDPKIRTNLLPFTFTRPVACIRVGIFTIAEKWERYLKGEVSFITSTYLQKKFPEKKSSSAISINGAVCPDPELVEKIKSLKNGQALVKDHILIAFSGGKPTERIPLNQSVTIIEHPWDIFQKNGNEIKADFELIKKHSQSQAIEDNHTIVYNKEQVFIESGAKIRAAVINAEAGPVYIGRNSEIQEGSVIRGPFALCEGSVVNMGGKMRGDTTIGPFCKVGGEISNSVIFGYSNKGHDGFMGNSVLGEWCNLGADTNTSNLKNNYGDVAVYDFNTGKTINTGLQFCGTLMGDHSKTSINTMINTGTVVGVCANIFGHGFPPKYVPSFSWGGSEGFEVFQLQKACEVAQRVMARRGVNFSEIDKEIFQHIFNSKAD